MVTVNEMDKWIACTDITRLGGYANPPLTCIKHFFTSPYPLFTVRFIEAEEGWEIRCGNLTWS